MNEIWKDINGYEGIYFVSNLGNIKSINKILKFSTHQGYSQVNLSKNKKSKTFKVHRIVAKHFIDNPYNLPEVDHINSIKSDNRIENLEWVTRRENITRRVLKMEKSSKYQGVSKNHNKWQAIFYANKKRKCLGTFNTEEEASIAYQNRLKIFLETGI